MIDTVEFRVHDLQVHIKLVEFLDKKTTGTGKSVHLREAEDDFTPQQKIIHKKYITFHDSGKLLQVAHFNQLKSSHYNIAYSINYLEDHIRFNVSLPKYAYGVNILLYNTAPVSPHFSAFTHSSIETNLDEAYDRLRGFFKKFFAAEFGSLPIYPELVEINRVDLCYNQVFPTKEAAIDYLHQIKKIKKKYSRDSSNFSRDWKTTMSYVTKRYSFKCYHKGSEFKKNDAPKLRELNQRHKENFDVEAYQDIADKILRYEMTFRNTYMSYLFMRHIFRNDDDLWQEGFKLWTKDKTKRENTANEGLAWREFRASLSRDEKKAIQYVNSLINKSKQFYLESSNKKEYDTETDHWAFSQWPERDEPFHVPARFSRKLFRLMSARFLKMVNEFRLTVAQDQASILEQINRHNSVIANDRTKLKAAEISGSHPMYKAAGKQIQPSKIKMILELLQYSTFDEIGSSGLFSRKTWYNYRKVLEQFGYTENSLATPVTPTPLDLASYNNIIMQHSRKFKNLLF